ncbi:hypothetical protein [Sphingobacterium sp.]|uniref:hypothetical protein n=1 Tax=Sphingobacterium sp. TaxID=341027 RepID=UPI0031D2FFCE
MKKAFTFVVFAPGPSAAIAKVDTAEDLTTIDAPQSHPRNAFIAGVFSLVFPGLGQVYNGQIKKGIMTNTATGFLQRGLGKKIKRKCHQKKANYLFKSLTNYFKLTVVLTIQNGY